MTGKNLEEFSLAHSRAIACPTVKNLLLASKAALDLTDDQNDQLSAWAWYAAATDLASTGGIKFQSVNSRFPPTWFALRQVDEALKRLPDKNKAASLKAGLRVLNLINDLDPTGDQWRECTRADALCSAAGVPIWDSFGIHHIPALDEAKEVIEAALANLSERNPREVLRRTRVERS